MWEGLIFPPFLHAVVQGQAPPGAVGNAVRVHGVHVHLSTVIKPGNLLWGRHLGNPHRRDILGIKNSNKWANSDIPVFSTTTYLYMSSLCSSSSDFPETDSWTHAWPHGDENLFASNHVMSVINLPRNNANEVLTFKKKNLQNLQKINMQEYILRRHSELAELVSCEDKLLASARFVTIHLEKKKDTVNCITHRDHNVTISACIDRRNEMVKFGKGKTCGC